MRRPVLLASMAAIAALAVLAAACTGGGSDGSPQATSDRFPDVVPLGEGDFFPVITNSSLAVGENRFSLGLLDGENAPILGADVHLAFYDLGGGEELKSETDALFVPVELAFVDEESGGETRVVGDNGLYVATASFDRAGDWGVEVTVTRDGEEPEPVPFRFNVLERTPEPAVGEPAPASEQLTLADVADVAEIDSSFPPRPEMHEVTLADALAAGRPIVVAFATPAFCESRVCAPVMDTIMDPLYEKYGDEATFIHIEPFSLAELRAGTARIPVQATEGWGLRTEPWLFVIDGEGKVAAKFEGIMSLAEVEAALAAALGEAADGA